MNQGRRAKQIEQLSGFRFKQAVWQYIGFV
jgi:hypothetical protein